MPAIRTPLASREGEPAKARPSTIAARPATAARIAVRCQSRRRWARVLRRRRGRGRTREYLRRAGKVAKSSHGSGGFFLFGAASLKREELDPAADVQADAGDVRREVGAEEDDRIRDILRFSGP